MPPELPFVVFGSLGMACIGGWLLRPIVMGLGKRLERHAAPDAALLAEVDELRQRLGTLDGVEQRLLEVEERLEFTERMLTQQREPARLQEGER